MPNSTPGRAAHSSWSGNLGTWSDVSSPVDPEAKPGSCLKKKKEKKHITISFFSHPIMQLHETPIHRREANPAFPPVSDGFWFPDL